MPVMTSGHRLRRFWWRAAVIDQSVSLIISRVISIAIMNQAESFR